MQAGGAASPSHIPYPSIHPCVGAWHTAQRSSLPSVTPTAVLSIHPSQMVRQEWGGMLFSWEVQLKGAEFVGASVCVW